MKIKKILKVLYFYVIFILFGIWLNNFMHDKDFYYFMLDIFNRFDYRAINIVFLIYQGCTLYCIFNSILFIVNKFRKKDGENNV